VVATAQTIEPAEADWLERILQLADAERRAHVALMASKGHDIETFLDAHGEAVENLHNELYRMLDARATVGNPVPKLRMPPDPRKELKKQIVARLKEELPSMVASVIDEF
jgi:hypothetical protein